MGIFKKLFSTNNLSNRVINETTYQMVQCFDSSRLFSIMLPDNWHRTKDDTFTVNSPNEEVSIGVSIYQITSEPDFPVFYEARFKGVVEMGIYHQVSEEVVQHKHQITREYEGVWPNDTYVTHYVVSCFCERDIYCSLGMVANQEYFNSNRTLLSGIINSFEIHNP